MSLTRIFTNIQEYKIKTTLSPEEAHRFISGYKSDSRSVLATPCSGCVVSAEPADMKSAAV